MNSYILYEPNNALHAFTAAPMLQFQIFDPRGKIVQNIKFLSVNQNNDLISKLNPTRQQESRGMLDFENRAPDIKLLKIYTNRDNRTYFKKYDF